MPDNLQLIHNFKYMYNQFMSNKIISPNQLKNISFKAKKNNKKIVLVHGVFDVVHIGHIHLLLKRKNMAIY